MPKPRILLLDTDTAWTLSLSEALIQDNCEVLAAHALDDAMLLLQARTIDLLIADVNLPGASGDALLEQIRQLYPEVTILVCTAKPFVSQAVQATKLGVFDYKDRGETATTVTTVRQSVARAIQERGRSQALALSDPQERGLLSGPAPSLYGIISRNPQMQDIFELIQTIADSYANVLIYGETGTGKELVANAVHKESSRHGKPLVTMDCSALAPSLLESELFGHEKGAFTGATDRHVGRFERADGGTLFLDEVGNIDLSVQAKLLRVLQTKTFERVGGTKPISVDVRIIAATNRPLEECVAAGTFREDLIHRLNVIEIRVPPLRERLDDVPLLAMEFLRRFSRQHHKDVRGFTDAVVRLMNTYRWPGNVRELENVVLQAVVLARQPLVDLGDLPKRLTLPASAVASPRLVDQLEEPEKQILLNTLRQHAGNIKRTAEQLQISRTTLYAKLKKYNVDPDQIR